MSLRGMLKTSLVAAIAAGVALPVAANADQTTYRVVADRFHNPRGIALSPDGSQLYVAAGGKAGSRCVNVPAKGPTCVGSTGSLIRFNFATHARKKLATGLPSFGNRDGSFASGIDDVSVAPDGSTFGVMTNQPPFAVQLLPKQSRKLMGRVLAVRTSVKKTGRIAAFETRHDPDGQGLASGPYAITAASASTQYVADAGGNDVLGVTGKAVSLVDVLPNLGTLPATPTAITIGPGGVLYVGETVGGAGGAAQVVQILPGGLERVYASGLTRISGLDFGPGGVLYVTELTTSTLAPGSHGAVVEVLPLGVGRCTVPFSDQLSFPASGVVSNDGQTVYVANGSVLPAVTAAAGRFGGAHGQIVSVPAAPLCSP
jgi:hypothetical protein